ARSYRDAREIDEAIRWYNRALELNRHHRDALFEMAEIRMHREEWPAAESLLRQVLDISPNDQPAKMNLAVARTRQGDAEGAMAIYDELWRESPDSVLVRYNR